jgi:hypothetical protein
MMTPMIQRPYRVRVLLQGRRTIFGSYVSLKAAHFEAAKLRALGWSAAVESRS